MSDLKKNNTYWIVLHCPTGYFSYSKLFNIIYQEFLKVNTALNTQGGQIS